MKKFFKFYLLTSVILFFVFLLSIIYVLFPTVLHAQVNWGPDVRLTYYVRGTIFMPKIALSEDTLHVVWYTNWIDTLEYTEVMYKRSTDRGETWTSDTVLSPIPPGRSEVPDIAVSGSVVHVVWTEEAGDSVVYIRSTDGGRTWLSPITMTQAGFSALVGVNKDTVFVKWGTTTGSYYRLSYDGGATWSAQYQIPRRPLGDTKVQIVGQYIHLVAEGYATDTSVIPEVFHQYSSDCGQTWSKPVMFSEQDIWGSQWPSIAVDCDSNVYVSWWDYKNSPYSWTGSIFTRVGASNGAIWDTIQNITTLYRAKRCDIAAYGNGVHVVWMDQRDYPGSPFHGFEVYYRYSSDRGNTWGPETRLTNDPNQSQDPRLAVDSGYVYLVWADNRDLDSAVRGYEVYFKRGRIEGGIETKKCVLSFPQIFEISSSIFRDEMRCYYNFSEARDWRIDVFDICGREVWHNEGFGQRGEVIWSCKDKRGRPVRSGVYFIRLQTGEKSYQQKVIILRGGKS